MNEITKGICKTCDSNDDCEYIKEGKMDCSFYEPIHTRAYLEHKIYEFGIYIEGFKEQIKECKIQIKGFKKRIKEMKKEMRK